MRLVNINYVNDSYILARPILGPNGNVLLQAGISLTQKYIERLHTMGIDMLYIQDGALEDVDVRPPISDQTRKFAFQTVTQISNYLEKGQNNEFKVDTVRTSISRMIEDLLISRDIVGNLSEIRGYDDYTYHHSVNTTVLALIIGLALGLTETKLLELGMGVMMHDVGKIKVPEEILNKVSPLTKEEFDEIKKHTVYGFEILRANRDLSMPSAHIALQHQEKWDGSGYPRGIAGEKIHEYARIAAVADVYEALTSRRVYRKAKEPYEAYEFMIAGSGMHFDPNVIKVFSRSIAIYPNGTGVSLSTGEQGYVVKQNKIFPNRPYIRIFYDSEGQSCQPTDCDLSLNPSLMITGVHYR